MCPDRLRKDLDFWQISEFLLGKNKTLRVLTVEGGGGGPHSGYNILCWQMPAAPSATTQESPKSSRQISNIKAFLRMSIFPKYNTKYNIFLKCKSYLLLSPQHKWIIKIHFSPPGYVEVNTLEIYRLWKDKELSFEYLLINPSPSFWNEKNTDNWSTGNWMWKFVSTKIRGETEGRGLWRHKIRTDQEVFLELDGVPGDVTGCSGEETDQSSRWSNVGSY